MKTMISKFPGTCRDCGAAVPRGASIAYHGRGRGVSCAKCAGLESEETAAARVVAVNFDRSASKEDWDCSDTAYEDRCAEACGL